MYIIYNSLLYSIIVYYIILYLSIYKMCSLAINFCCEIFLVRDFLYSLSPVDRKSNPLIPPAKKMPCPLNIHRTFAPVWSCILYTHVMYIAYCMHLDCILYTRDTVYCIQRIHLLKEQSVDCIHFECVRYIAYCIHVPHICVHTDLTSHLYLDRNHS